MPSRSGSSALARRAAALLLGALATSGCGSQGITIHASGTSVFYYEERGPSSFGVEWVEGGRETHVECRGRIVLTADDRAVESLDGAAQLEVRTRHDGRRDSLLVRPDDGLAPVVEFRVDGELREFDAPAQAWLADVLSTLARRTPVFARTKAERALEAGGPAAVLALLAQTESSAARRVYLELCLEQQDLTEDDLRALVRSTRERVGQNSLRVSVLEALATRERDNEELTLALVDAAGTIASSSSKRQVLEATARERALSTRSARALADASKGVASSSDRAATLATLLEHGPRDREFLVAWIEALETVPSSAGRRRALEAFFELPELEQPVLVRALEAVAALPSNSDRARLLEPLAAELALTGGGLDAFLAATSAISSSHSQADVLERLLERDDLGEEELAKILRIVERIASSSRRERLQKKLLERLLEDAG